VASGSRIARGAVVGRLLVEHPAVGIERELERRHVDGIAVKT
jgi:hypothetical protein